MHVRRRRQGAGPISSLIAVQGRLSESTEALLSLEKAQRLAEDVGGTRRACAAVLDVLRAAADWKGLNEHILLLAKRRSQLKQVRVDRVFHVSHPPFALGGYAVCDVVGKSLGSSSIPFLDHHNWTEATAAKGTLIWRWLAMQAIQAFVRQAMGFIDQTPDQESQVALIKTLQSVTEGKVRSGLGLWPCRVLLQGSCRALAGVCQHKHKHVDVQCEHPFRTCCLELTRLTRDADLRGN